MGIEPENTIGAHSANGGGVVAHERAVQIR
jgi:hypothetical protein